MSKSARRLAISREEFASIRIEAAGLSCRKRALRRGLAGTDVGIASDTGRRRELASCAPYISEHFITLGENPVRPSDYAASFVGKVLEPSGTQDDADAQLTFKAANSNRQRGLADVARRSGTAEVALFCERDEVFELMEKDVAAHFLLTAC